jgi:glycosyltransferase involved in cell wall biosynthesis
MKVTAAMIVLNGDHVLQQSLESIYDFVDEIVIAEGPVRFWQEKGVERSTDLTLDIIRSFNDPSGKIRLVSSKFSEKDEQFAAALDLMSSSPDYLLQVDADEVWTQESLSNLESLLRLKSPISVGVHSNSFVGGFDRVISGFEEKTDNFLRVFKWESGCRFVTHRPPTISYSNGTRTGGLTHVDSDEARDLFGISMCHYSYVWPSQVKSKIEYYRSKVSMQNCIPDFYQNYWLPWTKTSDVNEKWSIESKILGMHEFKPEVRGPAFTKIFKGSHPLSIQKSMITLNDRIKMELEHEQDT